MTQTAPLSDDILIAVSRLVDDAQTDTREPSHSDLEFQIERAGLGNADPKKQGQLVGKAKRIRGTLSWALENDLPAGEQLVTSLVSLVRSLGGFREESTNFVGSQAVDNAIAAFRQEGFELAPDGDLQPLALDNLTGKELTDALLSYVRRARRGIQDAALVTGTGKDLLEATAKHVLQELWGDYPQTNFPTLLGQAFAAVELATPEHKQVPNEPPQKRVERSMYELGCSINGLRNKTGTGHGRPWLSSVSEDEARIALELMGAIAERLLIGLKEQK